MDNRIGTIKKGLNPSWAYDMQGSFPIMWVGKAEELNRMVHIGYRVWIEDLAQLKASVRSNNANDPPPPSTVIVSFFLAALAIENLLKGALVLNHPEYIRDGRFRGSIIGSHNLVEIANDAGIQLVQNELEFCQLGYEAIMSFGRYHLGKSKSETLSYLNIKGTAFTVYEGLYNRLMDYILKNPLPSNSHSR